MTYRNILVHVGTDRPSEQRVRLAGALAGDFGASLAGLFVAPRLLLAAPFGTPAVVLGDELLEAQRRVMEEGGAAARELFERACSPAGAPTEFFQEEGEAGTVLSLYARYFDLCVVTQSESVGAAALVAQAPERVILASGGPVLVVPYAGTFTHVGEHILIAWNSSREAARAVHDALPLLARAGQVTVLEIEPEDASGETGGALARRLARHGVAARAVHTVSGGVAVGEILLSALADHDADLLVMGAYGHSRMRELALGGVTRSVLGHMTVPALMSY